MRVQDTSGTYYWHVPTGTTQWEPPGAPHETPSDGSTPTEGPLQLSWTSFAPAETFNNGDLWKVRGAGGWERVGGQCPPNPTEPPCP
uniref:Uncharacterized protein n=1 Tax=Junco hyemalis TaxID=40217 RepID=A0A8C5NMZ4_JUNHY